MAKKVLIIFENMGMGHRRMANILEDALKDREGIEIVKHAGSELLGNSDVEIIVKLWNFLIRKNRIRTVDVLINFALRMFILPFIEVSDTVPFLKKLDEINPDIIVCTADGFNKVIGTYASEKGIPFYIVITDISIFNDLVNTYATHICYFDETVEAIRSYDFNTAYFSYKLNRETKGLQKLKYILKCYNDYIIHAYKNCIYRSADNKLPQRNNARCRTIGLIAESKHFAPRNVDAIKQKYNIPMDRDTVLVASGSIGGQFIIDTVNNICKSCIRPLNVLAMCGRDKEAYLKILDMKNANSNVNIMPFEYTTNFDEFLAAADCVIQRPSAGTFIESLISRTPTVTFKLAPSNDKGSLTMIKKYKMGEICGSAKDLTPVLENLLKNKSEYKANIDKLLEKYSGTYEEKKALVSSIILG